ncbi:DUF2591 domain-containing protein [Pseudomonas sp. S60]|uniref:phage protein NinX family protein n=1 Tax=Pseudomonas sp. S60 TaxID=211124 RepID=UPI0019137207|nr:phage protein NinX family protein [Pseudomonas sp. S60]MBK5008438.1 DUF2591 domain-containing protein [Pseudomonas sp. S60]
MTDLIEVKTAELSGEALAWAVAKAEGLEPRLESPHYGNGWRVFCDTTFGNSKRYNPQEDWALGGPLKLKHRIGDGPIHGGWVAHPSRPNEPTDWLEAAEPLTAICRAVVVKITGWAVQVPKELMP